MLRWLYDRTNSLARHRRANWALGIVAFIESSVFPIPPDVILIPMVLAKRHRAAVIATICTICSVFGGLLGYAIGAFLFESFGKPILQLYGYSEDFSSFQNNYNKWGIWVVFVAGITPFPYKVITIASGVSGLSLPIFIISSLCARGMRFGVVSFLLWRFGEPIKTFIEKYLGLLFSLFIVLFFGGFILIKLL